MKNKNFGPFLVFNKQWFKDNQKVLLSWLNGSWWRRKLSRHIFRIDSDKFITEIGPSHYTVKLNDTQLRANLRTHPKYAKRIYYSFFWYWWLLHFFDWFVLDRFFPQLSFGFTSLNVKPDDGEAGDNCDGYSARVVTAGATWSSIRTGSGTTYSNTTTAGTMTRITAHADTDKYYAVRRAGFAFDTSIVGASSTISDVVLNLYSTDTYHVNTYDTVDDSLNVVSFTPSNAGAFAAADFNSFGSTIYCAMAYATYTASNGYKNFTLDAAGRNNINKTGISVYGIRVGSDISGTGITWKADADIAVGIRWVDYTGTSSDPSMDVTYTPVTPVWTERKPAGDANKDWITVASDSDGSNLMAAISNGRFYTSPNGGTDWYEEQPAGDVNKYWYLLASDGDGSVLLAGAYTGRLYLSTNSGVDWSEIRPNTVDENRNWYCAASDSDGTNLIVGEYNGRMWVSTDSGANWSETRPAGDINNYWYCVASDSDGSHLITGAYNGRLYISSNGGSSWSEKQPAGDVNKYWYAVGSDNDGSNLIACAYGGRLYTSSDSGTGWDERRPVGDTDQYWSNVVSDSDGTNLGACIFGGRLWISTDRGVTWSEGRPAGDANKDWYGLASDSDGTNLIAGVNAGRLYTMADPATAAISKVAGLSQASVAKISGVSLASIGKVSGVSNA